MQCDSCDIWTHRKCTNVTVAEYRRLGGSDDNWFCTGCLLPQFSDSYFDDTVHAGRDNYVIMNQSLNLDNISDSECLKSKGLNFIHINARSLLPKLAEIRMIAANSNIAVIGITESWLDKSVTDTEVKIPGYTYIRKDRNREGGGVGAYIRNDITYNTKDEHKNILETVWFEVLLPKTKPILVGICYRPPKQYDFYKHLEQFCTNIENIESKECIIVVDFIGVRNKNQVQNCSRRWCHSSRLIDDL